MIATVLVHRGHGRCHLDLVLAGGSRCPTLALVPGRPWRWHWQAPHRRRYLTFAGPIPGGRGTVARRWTGPVRLLRAAGGWRLEGGGGRLLLCEAGGEVVLAGPPPCWLGCRSKTPPRPATTPTPRRG